MTDGKDGNSNENDIAGLPSAADLAALTSTPEKPTDAPDALRRDFPEAAKRALAEAEERRRNAEDAAGKAATEVGGRGGLDPARFGDWEIKGRAIDF
ncbi:MAG: DUF1674 domain-containing protein [Martelella sp.]|nr:DUF1674 domain-containing protein [Martelella sp.]|tara:strand:+ start:1588 stop:1878 length:291 start_codon:yes stop_codon:yes gene_type:complete